MDASAFDGADQYYAICLFKHARVCIYGMGLFKLENGAY